MLCRVLSCDRAEQVLRRGGRRPALEPLLCGASDDGSDTPTAATPATPPTAPGSTQDFDIPAHEQLEPVGLHPLSGTPHTTHRAGVAR